MGVTMKTYNQQLGTQPSRRLLLTSVLPASLAMALGIGGLVNCSQSTMNLGLAPVGVPVSLTYKAPQFLNLEGGSSDLGLVSTATNLFVTVSSCASGYTVGTGASPQAITSVVNLYNGDRGCIIQLEKFTLGSTTYSSQGQNAQAFSSTSAGGVATFQDVNNTSSIIKVFIASHVTSPVTTAAVSFNFTDIQAGTTNNISQANVSTPVPLSATGQAAPNYTMPFARYLSTNSDGSGNISVTMACGATVSGTGATETCSGINLTTQLDYKLVEDTYGGTLTVAQANSIFSTDGTAITSDGSTGTGITIAAGGSDANSNTITNGGFNTSNSSPLLTTAAFYPSHLNYIFVLRQRDTTGAHNTLSYLYVLVTLTSITQG